jgi:hypothetical protein
MTTIIVIAVIVIVVIIVAPIAKGFALAVLHFFDFLIALFVPLGKCKCGERIICLRIKEGKTSYICRNMNCQKKTPEFDWVISAKSYWNKWRKV